MRVILGGRTTDAAQTRASWFPGRPADVPDPVTPTPLPAGIAGERLGGRDAASQAANAVKFLKGAGCGAIGGRR